MLCLLQTHTGPFGQPSLVLPSKSCCSCTGNIRLSQGFNLCQLSLRQLLGVVDRGDIISTSRPQVRLFRVVSKVSSRNFVRVGDNTIWRSCKRLACSEDIVDMLVKAGGWACQLMSSCRCLTSMREYLAHSWLLSCSGGWRSWLLPQRGSAEAG